MTRILFALFNLLSWRTSEFWTGPIAALVGLVVSHLPDSVVSGDTKAAFGKGLAGLLTYAVGRVISKLAKGPTPINSGH